MVCHVLFRLSHVQEPVAERHVTSSLQVALFSVAQLLNQFSFVFAPFFLKKMQYNDFTFKVRAVADLFFFHFPFSFFDCLPFTLNIMWTNV